MTPDPARLFHQPDLFPLQFHDGGLVFVPMSRDSYRASVYTDPARVQTAGDGAWAMPLVDLARRYQAAQASPERAVPAPPPALVLHMGHGGSTLLARALDLPAHALVVREPFTLRQLALAHAAALAPAGTPPAASTAAVGGLGPRQQAALLEMVLALLGRTHRRGVQAIVKANPAVNLLLPKLLALAPETRGLVLHAPLEAFVLQAVGAPERARWAQGLLGQLAPALAEQPAFADVAQAVAEPALAAAALWLAQRQLLAEALGQGPNLRSISTAQWAADPLAVLSAACPQLAMHPAAAELAAVVAGPLFQEHAGHRAELSAAGHAAELAAAHAWLDRQAPDEPRDGPLPRPLLA